MLEGIKLFFKEISELNRFFSKTPKSKKKIVFYAEHEGYYPAFEGLIEELTKKHKQTICYITSDQKDPIIKTKNHKVIPFYINKLIIFLMTSLECEAFVMTLTDLNQYHIKRSLKPVHYVYVYHALVSTHMMYKHGAFDYYDSVLCVGPHQIEELKKSEKRYKTLKKKLVKAGYYRLERIYDAYKKYSGKKKDERKKTILIAPSWGEKNVIESYGEKIVDMLLKENYEVIVRPHPETIIRFPEIINKIEKKFCKNLNFKLERSVRSDDSMLKADVLISDCSGITLEYAFGTERPILFLDVPKKIQNKEYEKLGIEPLELQLRPKIGVVVSTKKIEEVPKIIIKLIKDKGKYKKEIIRLRKKWVFAFGKSSKIGASHIMEILENKV